MQCPCNGPHTDTVPHPSPRVRTVVVASLQHPREGRVGTTPNLTGVFFGFFFVICFAQQRCTAPVLPCRWTGERAEIEANVVNKASLGAIDSALFVVALDRHVLHSLGTCDL